MVRIKAFNGIRPNNALASRIASPPYDVLDSDEARLLVRNNPHSFLHVVKSEVDLPPDVDLYDPRVYRKARENFAFFRENYMQQDKQPSMYVYRQVMDGRSQTGLIACQHIDDYLEGRVKIHELTREDKEQDRITHIDTVNANTGPVFYTYPQDRLIDALIAQALIPEPEYDFTADDGIRHTLWHIGEKKVCDSLIEAFARIPCVYVADGHHRSKASAMVGKLRREKNPAHQGNEEYNWFMAVFFPENQLYLMDYNRVVKDLNGLDTTTFLRRIGDVCKIEKKCCAWSSKPSAEHEMAMYLDRQWYRLQFREIPENPDPAENIDSALLTSRILKPFLGIENLRKDKRIDFVGGKHGLQELQRRVDSGEMALAFALYPISMRQLMHIADSNALMPPKTTWFEPKLRSGLLIHTLDE
ncbi:MAG: DUF1015 family protein [Candidatus Neomarinimicrobiota bacterium]|jgi:uncharacterized protein (DUF1015 family)|nr:DUF1015 family protein [Candidatus Neomarinimicrobiota bacterium]MDX9780488.1 DUF1015 family protein [bacterium]